MQRGVVVSSGIEWKEGGTVCCMHSHDLCRLAGAFMISVGVVSSVWAQQDDDVVARVGGDPITFADLEEAWQRNDASSRLRMLQDLYETRRRALDIIVGERLIAREAETRDMTRDELLEIELPSRSLPVTAEQIELIYQRNQGQFGDRTLEQMAPEIRMFLEQQRPMQALHAYMNELRREATDDVVVTLEPPRQEIEDLPEDPVRGPENAPIEIVEFSDFDCPYCQRATNTLAKILVEYGDQIRFVYKDYPLPSHPNAFKAAEAGNCANDQGQFWPFHDRLFERQGSLDVPSLKTYASELGLDTDAFETCLDSGQYASRVERDLQVGSGYGVSSTPTLFVNGRAVVGAMPYESFVEIIQEELSR